LVLLTVAAVAFGQEVESDQQTDAEQANGENGYAGTWSLVIGPSRLVWQLEAESYEFYAYQAGTVRIGSRGELTEEEGRLRFLPEEITNDGETWREIELPEEEAAASFAFTVEEETLRLALPGRPQFYTDYQAGSGEPPEGEGEAGTEGAGETEGAAQPGGGHGGAE
jgi:hypothetical protein